MWKQGMTWDFSKFAQYHSFFMLRSPEDVSLGSVQKSPFTDNESKQWTLWDHTADPNLSGWLEYFPTWEAAARSLVDRQPA